MAGLFGLKGARGVRRLAVAGVAAAVAAAVAGGCATKADDPAAAGGGGSGSVATGPGVTDKAITLGVLTDRTGVFAGAGKGIEQGRKLFWDAKNAAGGVCGRQVQFTVKDHGYDAQRATSGYAALKDDVLALDELLGAPMIAGLLPALEADRMTTLAASFSSALLANPYIVITGATYDLEIINGVDWLVKNRGLGRGQKIAHIYLDGDYGQNALAGARAAAAEHGLGLVEQKIKPTDTDLSAPVGAARAAGAKFVLLTTTPAQTASAAAVAQASGYQATFLANNPAYSPALLATPAKAALEKQLLVATSIAPFSSPAPGPAKVRAAFNTAYPGQPKTAYVIYGYAQGEVMARILQTACDNHALTRQGVLTAYQSLEQVKTDGLLPPLDYSQPGQPPARQVYLTHPDATAEGGATETAALFSAPLATTYTPTP